MIGSYDLQLGDCMERLKALPDGSVDSACTDPPYNLVSIAERWGNPNGAPAQEGTDGAFSRFTGGFMGRKWDTDIAFRPETWWEIGRVLKPGGYLVAFNHSRTWHRMAVAIEDAGFEIRDTLMWMYGSAMPHSHHVGLNLEKTLATNAGTDRAPRWVYLSDGAPMAFKPPFRHPDAERWYEWGTALKPGFEPIVLARRPLDGTVVDNALTYGTGALNIGGCRIPVLDAAYAQNASGDRGHAENRTRQMDFGYTAGSASEGGRWPANIVHDGSAEVLAAFGQYGDRGAAAPVRGSEPSSATKYVFGDRARQPGAFHGDEGTAARFFQECPWDDESLDLAARFYFSGKTSRSDRNEGCEHLAARPLHWSSGEANPGSFQSEGTDKKAKNHHPTVKPTSLMRWLTRLVTPPGGLVLDPFMGSGSTGKAAMLEGFRFLGMEAEPDYMEIAHARVALGLRQAEEATRQGVLIKPAPPPPSPLLRAAPRPQIDLFAAE